MKLVKFEDGLVIHGTFPNKDVLAEISKTSGKLPLVIADPPYGNIITEGWDDVGSDAKQFALWMNDWTIVLSKMMLPGAALYVWGGIGRPNFRPFFRYLSMIERLSAFQLSTLITWKKKRAYGIQWGYLFTREELAYFVLGDPKKPRLFNVPLLDKRRAYAGYNKDYPAKSEFYRRTNVWDDVTEILKGKIHEAQKPERLHEIPIEVHTVSGEWVLDPFAGSGTTARAARKLGRRWIVVEKDPIEFEKMIATLQ